MASPQAISVQPPRSSTPAPGRSRWILLPLILAAAVHHGMLTGFFRSDDFLNLYQIENEGLARFLLQSHGGHLNVGRNLLWFGMHELVGVRAWPYYAALLLLHLVNVGLLFGLARRVSGSEGIAVAVSTLFGCLTLAVESLAWISAAGHVLVGTCVLLVLRELARIREGDARLGGACLLRWALLLLFAATCHGIGLGVGVGFLLVLPFLVPREERRRALLLLPLAALLPLIYFWHRSRFGGADIHSSWPVQSPEKAALFVRAWVHTWSYGFEHLLVGPLLPAGRYADGVEAGTTVDTAAALWVGLPGLALLVWRAASDVGRRAWIGASLVVAASAYAMVVLGRGWSIPRLGMAEVAGVARYQYVAPAAIALALAAACGPRAGPAVRRGAAGWLAALAVAAALFGRDAWDPGRFVPRDGRVEYERAVADLQDEIAREGRPGRVLHLPNGRFRAVKLMSRRHRFPGTAAVFVLAFPENDVDGVPVRFVDENRSMVRFARRLEGSRAAELLLAEDEVPEGEVPPSDAR